MRGKPGSIEDAADTALWLVENGDCGGIYFAISEDDIQRVLRHPASMVASDGQVVLFGRANPHPRSYGTFARVLGRYVRELNTDRKSTRLNSSHLVISYAVFCLKKKTTIIRRLNTK